MSQTETVVESDLQVRCSRSELVETLGVVSRAVSTRSSVQVLSGLQLRAETGELALAATDMELSLRSSVAAEVGATGSVVVPGRLLLDIARNLPDAEVELSHRSGEGMLEITCGSAFYQVNTYSAEDFPRLPAVENAPTFSVPRDVFLET